MSVNSFPTPPSSSPLGRNRSSILSKFRSQLGQRNRSIIDFDIEPDDPWRSYFPGDAIHGTVALTVVRPVRITHLVICLHGLVKVFKNNVPSGEAPPDLGFLGPGRGRRGAEYMGNGVATLFEDEVVLCGNGRLKEGIYKFRFEMSFPPYSLPSSISFERGTISYMLTATLTKPTTINPTLSCRRRINLLENIDIAPFPAPKARVVTLEPVSKRSKSKAKAKSAGSDAPDSASLDPSVNGGAATDNRPPLSPAPSNVSSSSRLSNSSQSFQIVMDPGSTASTGVRNSEAHSISPSVAEKIITAKTEVLRAGVLPGDTLPIKVTINHYKQVRSTHGVIVTLYRQGRLDLHPAIPIGVSSDGKKPVYEDYYPRSRTGLGGLSIGTTRASSVFRKDLTQTFAPLVVDPTTLTAVVKTSIRIPEDAFPTITRTPGSMINFRYYVEVVVDPRGKLTSPERFLPRFNLVSSGSNYSPSGQIINPPEVSGNAITANWAGNILDTDQIRREKGVVAVAFEVVIGTRDSRRQKGQARRTSSTAGGSDLYSSGGNQVDGDTWPPDQGGTLDPEPDYPNHEDAGFPQEHVHWPDYTEESPQQPYPPPRDMFPSPQSEGPADEKARLRHAEQTLLPSQPPADPEAGASSAPDIAMPTAPVLPEDDHINDYHHLPSPVENGLPPALMSAESVQTVVAGSSSGLQGEPSVLPGDDKQELERQRLLMEASAPDDGPSGRSIHNGSTEAGPSAPIFHDDHDHQLVGGAAHGDELLPRYQR